MLRFNFDDPKLFSEFRDRNIDAVVCAVASDATLSQLPLIDAAVKAGIQHFIPTEVRSFLFPSSLLPSKSQCLLGGINTEKFASNTLNPVLPTLISWYRDKRTVHDRLLQAGMDNPNFKYTGIISGPFFSWGIASGFLGYDVKEKTAWLYDEGTLPVSYSEISQVGLAVARSLERGVTGYLSISSITTTQNEIVKTLERLSGATWRKDSISTSHAYALSGDMMKSENEEERFKGSMLRAMRWVYGADCGGNWEEGDNAEFGLETKKNMDEMVKLALKEEFK